MTTTSSSKNIIADPFRRIAQRIVRCQKLDIDTSRVLFLLDRESPLHPYSGSEIYSLTPLIKDVIYQLSGKKYECIIKLRERNLNTLAPKQVKALIYHELRHIYTDKATGEMKVLRHHDYDDWKELVEYGDWEIDGKTLPDVAEENLPKECLNEKTCPN